VIVI